MNSKASGDHATNSNQEYSTVPRNNAVEVGEMVTVDHVGTSVGDLDEDGEQLDNLEMQWRWGGRRPRLELRSLLHMDASRKIISVDSKKMSPILWKTLPKELLVRVFACLPLPDITRLRNLSKEWNRDMLTVNSEINRALDEASPTVVVGLSFRDYPANSEFLVTICDLSAHRSPYSYLLHPGDPISHENRWDDMGARDGGLVCFVSTWEPTKANPLCIVVVNLLTRVQRKLPPLKYVYLTLPNMVHIEVDSKTKCYKVVVVSEHMKVRPTVEIYDSGTKKWTGATPPCGSIFGFANIRQYPRQYHRHYKSFTSTDITQSVYDFAEGQLKRCDERDPSRGASVMTHLFQKDCMFVLHRNTSNGENVQAEGYCITKYRLQSNAKDWVQERSYLCSPFEHLPESICRLMTLKACEGFLIAFKYSSGIIFWLLDLSTGEWNSHPNCLRRHECEAWMSRASWNVVP